jgi:hypothetical protein
MLRQKVQKVPTDFPTCVKLGVGSARVSACFDANPDPFLDGINMEIRSRIWLKTLPILNTGPF